jgi:hypothetical protein
MIEKNGMLTEKSHCDLDKTKLAEYYDEESDLVVSSKYKDKLKKPVLIGQAEEGKSE